MSFKKRFPRVHLRHSWVTSGQPGEPVHLQCTECCKVKVLKDPEGFDRRVRRAAGTYRADFP